jgi:hypothetical protein
MNRTPLSCLIGTDSSYLLDLARQIGNAHERSVNGTSLLCIRSPFLTSLTEEASRIRASTISLTYSRDLRQLIAALLQLDVSDSCPIDGFLGHERSRKVSLRL